jgi:hypothetical protein
MAYYELDHKKREHLGALISEAEVKGSDAIYVIECSKALAGLSNPIDKDQRYVSMSDELVRFLLTTIDNVIIRGKMALIIIELQLALKRRLDVLPTTQSDKDKKSPEKPPEKPAKLQPQLIKEGTCPPPMRLASSVETGKKLLEKPAKLQSKSS